MKPARRQRLLERYRTGLDAVLVAIDHIPDRLMDARPEPKSLTARELVHHIAYAELHNSVNLRRILAENRPVLVPLEDLYHVERLHYDRPIKHSLQAFHSLGLANAELLECLTEEQWQREGNQQKPWPLTVEDWLEGEVTHVLNHMMHILNASTGGRVLVDPPEGPSFLAGR